MFIPFSATHPNGGATAQFTYQQAVAVRDALRRDRNGAVLAARLDQYIVPRSPNSTPFRLDLTAAELELVRRVSEPLP